MKQHLHQSVSIMSIAIVAIALCSGCSNKMTSINPPAETRAVSEPTREDTKADGTAHESGEERSGGKTKSETYGHGKSIHRESLEEKKIEQTAAEEIDNLDFELNRLEMNDREMELESEISDADESESPDEKREILLRKIEQLSKKKAKLSSASGVEIPVVEAELIREEKGRMVTGASAASVKAGSHDDNEEFAYYQDYCDNYAKLLQTYPWDITERYVISVLLSDSVPAFNRSVVILDDKGDALFSARTQAGGEVVIFPHMDIPSYTGEITDYSIRIDQGRPQTIAVSREKQIECQVDGMADYTHRPEVQICFLIDATGSMGDEIRQLQDVIFSIHTSAINHPTKPKVSFSIVTYRDSADDFLVKGYPFTADIDAFQIALESVEARGGGDYPEDIESGLAYSLDTLSWESESMKFVFLIADAPPHLNRKEKNYLWASRRCREQGIMVTPIGASGLNSAGEFVFRQMAILTNGEFVFLHYGEKGESDGGGVAADPGKVSHHTGSNYNARRLDQIVLDIIGRELDYRTRPRMIVHDHPQPLEQQELLDIRMSSLIRQVFERARKDGMALAVAPIDFSDPSLADVSDYLWEYTIEKLPSLANASVVERARIEEVFKQQALSLSGATTGNNAQIGKLLDAEYLLFSKIHFLGSMRVCHMRLVECATGHVVSAGRVKM